MREFSFATAATVGEALDLSSDSATAFLAGGTTLVDLMKLNVLQPRRVLDINALPLRQITPDAAGLTVGSGTRMSDLADHPEVERDFGLITEALLAGASQQLRNMASVGGNLLQRTRCSYYRDVGSACNRREPGSGCAAITGSNRMHAILGTSTACVATHPSDLAVALLASDAIVHVAGTDGPRAIPIGEFYYPPGDSPDVETALRAGELITAVRIPRPPAGTRAAYVKVRDRASYEFALASAAVRLVVSDGIIAAAGVAVGGVATIPWRLPGVEESLVGRPAAPGHFETAVASATSGARALEHNAFKIPLLERTLLRAIEKVVEMP